MTVLLCFSALLWQEMKQLYHDGLIAHFSSVYNHMDFCMLKFYIASLTLRFTTYLKVSLSRSFKVIHSNTKVSVSRSFKVIDSNSIPHPEVHHLSQGQYLKVIQGY